MSSNLYTRLAWLPEPPKDFYAQCSALLHTAENLGPRLRTLASYSLDQNQLERLARITDHAQTTGADLRPLVPFRIGLLSNSTVDFLIPAIVATAARYGIALQIVQGEFDQSLQDAVSPDSAVNRFAPDAVLIAVDHHGLPISPSPGDASAERSSIHAALDYLDAIRKGIKRNTQAICILQMLAPPPETLFGSLDGILPGSVSRITQGVNAGIAQELLGSEDVVFDVGHLAATVGLADWHCPRDWNLGKFPFSDVFVPLYADHFCRILAALRGKSRRCLIIDLDNTLWGGVIGDDGLDGIQLAQGDAAGEAFQAVQRMALGLRARGIVLAVCSKNEDDMARMPFRSHPEMLLREDHIAIFQANWQDKPSNIRAITHALSLGLESVVFMDDNPAEREFVRKALPEVAVPELPDDPAFYARTLNAAGYFESVSFSREDVDRADFYQDNARRVQLQQQSGDLESYLRSLNMEITFQPFDATGRARIAQLINKSNQFNLTTRRYTEAQVAEWERDPEAFPLQVRLRDSFGDNGMICVVICHESNPGKWEIDTWLMSCRVLGRRVENAVLKHLLDHAKKRGISVLRGVYIPTDRNRLVAHHYSKLGFTQVAIEPNGATLYELDVASAIVQEDHMRVRCHCGANPDPPEDELSTSPRQDFELRPESLQESASRE